MIHSIKNRDIEISVDSLGSGLTSLRSSDDIEYLWQGSRESWTGQSPVLFPIIGGLQDDRYQVDGREYKMVSHGFARRKEWALLESGREHLVFSLDSDEETRAQYPFEFRFLMTYTLDRSWVSIAYRIENRGDTEMPFSVGAHPGFRCPLEEGRGFADYQLRFAQPESTVRYLKEGKLLTGETELFDLPDGVLPLSHALFEQGALIFRSFASNSMQLERAGGGPWVKVEFDGFPDLGIWSYPEKPAPFICIEPWFGVDSTTDRREDADFRTKTGMVNLAPGNQFDSRFVINVG